MTPYPNQSGQSAKADRGAVETGHVHPLVCRQGMRDLTLANCLWRVKRRPSMRGVDRPSEAAGHKYFLNVELVRKTSSPMATAHGTMIRFGCVGNGLARYRNRGINSDSLNQLLAE